MFIPHHYSLFTCTIQLAVSQMRQPLIFRMSVLELRCQNVLSEFALLLQYYFSFNSQSLTVDNQMFEGTLKTIEQREGLTFVFASQNFFSTINKISFLSLAKLIIVLFQFKCFYDDRSLVSIMSTQLSFSLE